MGAPFGSCKNSSAIAEEGEVELSNHKRLHGFVSTLSTAQRELLVVASSVDKGNGSTNSDRVSSRYQLPPKERREIVDAPPTTTLSFSSKRDEILFLEGCSLPPVSELAKLELKLGGLHIDPNYNS